MTSRNALRLYAVGTTYGRRHCRTWPDPLGCDIVANDGALAQLGERLHGMQEVSGSIPLGSTSFAD